MFFGDLLTSSTTGKRTQCECICISKDEYERLRAQEEERKKRKRKASPSATGKKSKAPRKVKAAESRPKRSGGKKKGPKKKGTTVQRKAAKRRSSSRTYTPTPNKWAVPQIGAGKSSAPYRGKKIAHRTRETKELPSPAPVVIERTYKAPELPPAPEMERQKDRKRLQLRNALKFMTTPLYASYKTKRKYEAPREISAPQPREIPQIPARTVPALPPGPREIRLEDCSKGNWFQREQCRKRNREKVTHRGTDTLI